MGMWPDMMVPLNTMNDLLEMAKKLASGELKKATYLRVVCLGVLHAEFYRPIVLNLMPHVNLYDAANVQAAVDKAKELIVKVRPDIKVVLESSDGDSKHVAKNEARKTAPPDDLAAAFVGLPLMRVTILGDSIVFDYDYSHIGTAAGCCADLDNAILS